MYQQSRNGGKSKPKLEPRRPSNNAKLINYEMPLQTRSTVDIGKKSALDINTDSKLFGTDNILNASQLSASTTQIYSRLGGTGPTYESNGFMTRTGSH